LSYPGDEGIQRESECIYNKRGNAGHPREPSHLLGPRGPKQLCQSVGREARQANTSDKPERLSHTYGDDCKPELSASCQARAGNRKPEVTEASRNHLDARKPAPDKANGGAGIWSRTPPASRLMPSGLARHGDDREAANPTAFLTPITAEEIETEYDPPVTPVRSWRAVVGSERPTRRINQSGRTSHKLGTTAKLKSIRQLPTTL
jgi:hypothetical protein